MKPAIEMLMNEHRMIERVLGSLDALGRSVENGAAVERSRVKEFGLFFRSFADRCHHGKEEDRLFVKMVEAGFPKEQGPIAVMLADHVEGRTHVGALVTIGEGIGPLSEGERRSVSEHAFAYVPMLLSHIQKEDQVLYPMALQILPSATMDALAEEFELFEQGVMGEGEHARFHALAEELIAAYPAAGSHAHASCGGCAG